MYNNNKLMQPMNQKIETECCNQPIAVVLHEDCSCFFSFSITSLNVFVLIILFVLWY